MTTDTKPKLAYEEFTFNNKIIRIAAIAKGSGMIAPNLATMLSFIFTDADIPSNLLKTLLKKALLLIPLMQLQLIAINQLMIWYQFFQLEK